MLEKRDSKMDNRGVRCGVEGNGRVPGVAQQQCMLIGVFTNVAGAEYVHLRPDVARLFILTVETIGFDASL